MDLRTFNRGLPAAKRLDGVRQETEIVDMRRSSCRLHGAVPALRVRMVANGTYCSSALCTGSHRLCHVADEGQRQREVCNGAMFTVVNHRD